jgi:4-hydroxy-tetrahydrodipicolinate synthase
LLNEGGCKIGSHLFSFPPHLYFFTVKEIYPMSNQPIFRGAATAIITPMREGTVDYDAYGKLIDWQLAQGINAIVAAGTTGEASTLTDEEHREVIRYTVERVGGKVPVIAGTGSNDTAYAIDLTRYACEVGADAMLLVTPYYNKATQKGLITSFTAIADASDKPIILYNVPSRTGCNILPKTAAALAEHPMITSIKEASGNISQIAELAALTQGKLDIYSGNDDQIVPILALGGQGVISVLSNVLPAQTVAMCDAFFAGDIAKSRALQLQLLPLINALFCEVNPIPVKAAMHAMGFCGEEIRLPLTVMEDDNREKLLACMREAGINV